MAEEVKVHIEALETIKSRGYFLEKDDRIHVDQDTARHWCGQGWAQDLSGNIPTGERVVVRKTLNPAGMVHSNKAESPGG